MEITEQTLEQLIQKQRNLIETKIAALTPTEIAIASNKIPAITTMLEYREFRSEFARQFEKPLSIPKPITFSEQLLSGPKENIRFPCDQRKFLIKFFKKETKRVKQLTKIVSSRINTPEMALKNQNEYSLFMDAVSHHLALCEEGLERLSAQTLMTFNANDLFLELTYYFMAKRRKAMFCAYLESISLFPMTRRKKIFQTLFEDTQKRFLQDTSQVPIPVQIVDEPPLDKELIRLAKRFNIKPDLDSDDGQQFVYHANKTFESMFPNLNTFEFPQKSIHIPSVILHPGVDELTQRTVIAQAPHDFRLSSTLNQIVTIREFEISVQIREISQYYNTSVGNQVKGQSVNYEKNKKLLPLHKISAWLELRFIHIKFLSCAILSLLNYFEYVKYRLTGKHGASKLKIGHSPSIIALIEISDENGPFIFQSAYNFYEELKDRIVAVGSYYLSRLDSDPNQNPDREAILEKLLQYEFRFLNAKRKVVQALLEALDHGKDSNLIRKIHEAIHAVPILNLPIYKSFDVPYETAIELIERRADVLRTLINLQVHHERQASTQIPDFLEVFDRPLCLNAENKRIYDESVPISPFEVYKSLTGIYKFLDLIPRVVSDLGEKADIRLTKFGQYLEIAVLKEISSLLTETIQHGYFPFDRPSDNFHFLLSDSVNSLLTSPYVNNLSAIASLMGNMKEGRKLRFLLSARKFAKITWTLQKSIIRTNQLQAAYFTQCDILGISERSVLLSSFKDNAKKQLDDMQSTSSNDKIIDFAFSELEAISINFSSQSTIKDIIFIGNYDKLNEIVRFQKLQNAILEVAVRYNSHLLDSDFFVEFFDLDERKEKEKNTLFLTEADNTEVEGKDDQSDEQNQSFFKNFLAAQMFTVSTAIYRDNQIAYEDKAIFSVPIKTLKMRTRSFLATQYKSRIINHDELVEMYINEMLDSFSCFMYRSEIAHITNLERQILLSNSFVDTFQLGPDPTTCLVNEAGRFEKFFYVPTWVECFRMMQSAPQQRQSIVLKPTLQYVVYRYQLLSLLRFESSMTMKASQVFESLSENQFPLETGVFQKLYNEFQRLPSAREIDVSANYIGDRLAFFFYRFEYTILTAYESFFVSLNVEAKRMPSEEKDQKIRISGVSDFSFGDTIKHFWLEIHDDFDNSLMTNRRYVQRYQTEFLSSVNEIDRNEIMLTFLLTDKMIEEANVAMRHNPFMDTFQVLPALLDFLKNSISLIHMKFAMFLLLYRVNETEINPKSSVLLMNQEIYIEGTPMWNKSIVNEAYSILVPRDEPLHTDPPPITKLHEAYYEQMRYQIDTLLLSNQIKTIQSSINRFSNDFSTLNEKSSLPFKPDFLANDNVLKAPVSNQLFLIEPRHADRQFNQENKYSHVKFVDFVANALDACTLERRNHDNTYSTIFDGDGFEENCHKLTTALEIFYKGSLSDMNMTWKQYIATMAFELKKNYESGELIERLMKYIHNRFDCQAAAEIATKFSDQIFELNSLNDQLHKLNQSRVDRDNEIAESLTVYFDHLIDDINKEIDVKKSMFSGIKQNVYEGVMEKIKKAQLVKLALNPAPNNDDDKDSKLDSKNEEMLKNIREENEFTKKKVLTLRIIRCLVKVSVTRYFKKRLIAVENDRRQANATLWSNKLQYETQEATMIKQLDESRKRLTDTEIEVEKLKQQLENEKMNNSQLVHWKAKNLKTIETLKEQISSLKKVGDVNIDDLLEKLQSRQSELDKLRIESDELDKSIEDAVRKPMKEVERLRNEVLKTRAERSEMIMTLKNDKGFDERMEKELSIQAIFDENAQLKHSNQLLKAQIEEIESRKEKKARDVKSYMERTTQPPPPTLRSVTKVPGTIIKPSVMGRSLSRI
ncbi:hypothetical protein TRFO_09520 [Tritrichomonas foetus]|uniref:Uncharacterized protein n=1 Tax=Tritrichomonas foetus TaxID=1144522 RepID=A0A1J4JI47_9EUKA|nr:hypothetical protein TRFO_09520 [Tritrichomonas foetus]|eukprot:OHS97259.1 hypothetical protein TRFO_09520 [Tritrichomonas foetus]